MKAVLLWLVAMFCVQASTRCSHCGGSAVVTGDANGMQQMHMQTQPLPSPHPTVIVVKTDAEPPSLMDRVISLLAAVVVTVCAAILALRAVLVGLFAILFIVAMASLVSFYWYDLPAQLALSRPSVEPVVDV